MGAHGLSAAFTVDAGYETFAVPAFMLVETQRPPYPAGRAARRLLPFASAVTRKTVGFSA